MQEVFEVISSKFTMDEILTIEIRLFQYFSPELKFHHPQNLIKSIMNDFKEYAVNYATLATSSKDDESISKTYNELKLRWDRISKQVMRSLQLTDAITSYSPLVMAIFVLQKSFYNYGSDYANNNENHDHNKNGWPLSFDDYLRQCNKFEEQKMNEIYAQVNDL